MKINKIMQNKYLYGFTQFLRIVLGCIFLLSSIPKIQHSYDFLSNIYGYELVGAKTGMMVAMILPWLELLLGICLVGGVFISGALLVSLVLSIIFCYVQISVIQRGLLINCGCFGFSSKSTIDYSTVIRTFLILIISFLAYLSVLFKNTVSKYDDEFEGLNILPVE